MLRIQISIFIVLAVLPNYHCVVDEKEFEALKEEVQNLRTMLQAFQVQLLSSQWHKLEMLLVQIAWATPEANVDGVAKEDLPFATIKNMALTFLWHVLKCLGLKMYFASKKHASK